MTYLSQNSRIPSMTIRRFPKWTALQFALDFYAFAFIIVFVFTQGLENTPLPPFLKFALGFFAIVWIGFIIDRTPPPVGRGRGVYRLPVHALSKRVNSIISFSPSSKAFALLALFPGKGPGRSLFTRGLTMIQWEKVNKEDTRRIHGLAKRAAEMGEREVIRYPLLDAHMDIAACHIAVPLDLEALAAANDDDFFQEIFGGIRRHLNRHTGELENSFTPCFALSSKPAS